MSSKRKAEENLGRTSGSKQLKMSYSEENVQALAISYLALQAEAAEHKRFSGEAMAKLVARGHTEDQILGLLAKAKKQAEAKLPPPRTDDAAQAEKSEGGPFVPSQGGEKKKEEKKAELGNGASKLGLEAHTSESKSAQAVETKSGVAGPGENEPVEDKSWAKRVSQGQSMPQVGDWSENVGGIPPIGPKKDRQPEPVSGRLPLRPPKHAGRCCVDYFLFSGCKFGVRCNYSHVWQDGFVDNKVFQQVERSGQLPPATARLADEALGKRKRVNDKKAAREGHFWMIGSGKDGSAAGR